MRTDRNSRRGTMGRVRNVMHAHAAWRCDNKSYCLMLQQLERGVTLLRALAHVRQRLRLHAMRCAPAPAEGPVVVTLL